MTVLGMSNAQLVRHRLCPCLRRSSRTDIVTRLTPRQTRHTSFKSRSALACETVAYLSDWRGFKAVLAQPRATKR
ncbi:hypothetical protein NOCA250086 [metagenome]|uniref:Uncharacterized protein n=1 Tax=metagenome TaxID=256318 RepID=A0A2P2C921_9ZZZZ